MEKALAILEKYVQWIALGLCGLFLVAMVYSYVLQDPVTVDLAGKPQLPGEIDKTIASMPEAQNLKRAVNGNQSIPATELPKIPSAVEAFAKVMTPAEKIQINGGPGPVIVDNGQVPPPKYSNFVLATAATYVDSMTGRAVLGWQKAPPPAPVAPAAAGNVPPPVAVAPAQAQAVVIDVDYTSHLWKAKIEDWTKAMEVAGIKRGDQFGVADRLQIIGVELRRQEKLPTGEWDVAHEVTVAPPAYLDFFQPFDANDKDPTAYMNWAALNLRNIVQPPFPQVMSGQPWAEPGQPLPAPVQNQGGGVPAPIPGVVPPAVPGGIAPRTSGFGEGMGPDSARPGVRPGIGGGIGPAPALIPQGQPATGIPPAVPGAAPIDPAAAAVANAIPGEGVERAMFNPYTELDRYVAAGAPAEVKFYTHDLTCQGSKTYRYRMRYFLRNPFKGASQSVTGAFTDPWYVASPYSDWSKEITIPPRIEIYATKIIPSDKQNYTADSADFDVFVARQGGWPKVHVHLMPGDPIAGRDNQGNEWNSGWTLVDVRKVPKTGKYYLLIADANGKMERRDPEMDAQDPNFQLRNAVPGGGVPGTPELGAPPPVVPGGGTGAPPPLRPPPTVRPGIGA